MFYEAEFWVAVAFVILMGVFAYLGVHRTVLKALDHRSERIKAELDDARRLKDEAAKLLAEYQARYASAEREAQTRKSALQAASVAVDEAKQRLTRSTEETLDRVDGFVEFTSTDNQTVASITVELVQFHKKGSTKGHFWDRMLVRQGPWRA